VHLVVHEDEDGWSSRAATIDADLCARMRGWVEAAPAPARRHDYVHGDLNLSNALHIAGRLTGIVDLENLGVGDRTVDLARQAFEAHRRRDEATGSFMRAGARPTASRARGPRSPTRSSAGSAGGASTGTRPTGTG
jgi:aminoglycoside phosphotransferase (APT) family kinase protein